MQMAQKYGDELTPVKTNISYKEILTHFMPGPYTIK